MRVVSYGTDHISVTHASRALRVREWVRTAVRRTQRRMDIHIVRVRPCSCCRSTRIVSVVCTFVASSASVVVANKRGVFTTTSLFGSIKQRISRIEANRHTACTKRHPSTKTKQGGRVSAVGCVGVDRANGLYGLHDLGNCRLDVCC